MFWKDSETETAYRVPEDIFDLVFKLKGDSMTLDHAYALAQALRAHLATDTCERIGVHGISMAESGNGWNRPEAGDASLPLPRRARLVIRLQRDDYDELAALVGRKLEIGSRQIELGDCSVRKLSTLGTLFSRAVSCDRDQREADFLEAIATDLARLNIPVAKMICGKSRLIDAGDESLFTRTLLVADLKPQDSVALQRQGLGRDGFMGCGLFIPHKGIAAVPDFRDN